MIVVLYLWFLTILYLISGSWINFTANLCLCFLCFGLCYVAIYIIIGVCNFLEHFIKGKEG